MLLVQKPNNIADYCSISDCKLGMFLQLRGSMPRYYWQGYYYFERTDKLIEDLKLYYKECEREVSGFVEGL